MHFWLKGLVLCPLLTPVRLLPLGIWCELCIETNACLWTLVRVQVQEENVSVQGEIVGEKRTRKRLSQDDSEVAGVPQVKRQTRHTHTRR